MFFRDPKVFRKEIDDLVKSGSVEHNFYSYFIKAWSHFGQSIKHLNENEFRSAAASFVDSLTYHTLTAKELFLNIETLVPSFFRLFLTMIEYSLAKMNTNLVTDEIEMKPVVLGKA